MHGVFSPFFTNPNTSLAWFCVWGLHCGLWEVRCSLEGQWYNYCCWDAGQESSCSRGNLILRFCFKLLCQCWGSSQSRLLLRRLWRGVTPSKLPKIKNGRFWHRSWRWWVEGDWQEGWRNVISQPEVMFCHQKKAAGGRSFPESWTGILPQTWVLLAPETEPTSSLLCPH